MWGIVPAAGRGARLQPLGFSKELLPIGAQDRLERRPRAVAEFILERMIAAGVDRICMVIAPGKSDILNFFGAAYRDAPIAYVIQPQPLGLCDAVFRACAIVSRDERVVIGLPDTIWHPVGALARLPRDEPALLLFPTDRPEQFDSVGCDQTGRVTSISVKSADAASNWIWGAIGLPSARLHELRDLWLRRARCDEFLGTLLNAYLATGGTLSAVKAGERYIDVGTLDGYRDAFALDGRARVAASAEIVGPNGCEAR